MKLIPALLIFGILASNGWNSAVAQVVYDPNFQYDGHPRPLEYFQKILPVGMKKEKVVRIMGSPNSESKDTWFYWGKVLNPTTGNKRMLWVEFDLDWKVIEVRAP